MYRRNVLQYFWCVFKPRLDVVGVIGESLVKCYVPPPGVAVQRLLCNFIFPVRTTKLRKWICTHCHLTNLFIILQEWKKISSTMRIQRIRKKFLNWLYLFLFRTSSHIRGCSAVVARSLRMWKAPGSNPGISRYLVFLR